MTGSGGRSSNRRTRGDARLGLKPAFTCDWMPAFAGMTIPDLAFERAQRAADARDDGVPGAAFRLRIDQVEAVDRSAGVAREIAAAVEHDPSAAGVSPSLFSRA